MRQETANERRTRLIEQYAGLLAAPGKETPETCVSRAKYLADAVIAATPQEPTRYLSEIAARLIELVEVAVAALQARGGTATGKKLINELAAIKRDLGIP